MRLERVRKKYTYVNSLLRTSSYHHLSVLAEYLHSEEVSRIVNYDKVPIVVDNGI